MPWSKEETAIYNKQRYQLNKDKIKQQAQEYKELNKDKISQQKKLHYQLNKEKINQKQKEYYHLNKEEINKKNREYSQTEAGIKSSRIRNWKRSGMILRDYQTWDSVYTKYLDCTNCEQCNKVFQTTLDRQLDHCHTTGFIRNIVCCRCNQLRAVEDAKNLILE